MTTYGPYSSYQEANGLIFTAGQIGAQKSHAVDDIVSQTTAALQNLGKVLADAGASLATVVKTTVYLTDMKDYEAMNDVYVAVFTKHGCSPARATIAVTELPRVADCPLLIEIEAIATKEAM